MNYFNEHIIKYPSIYVEQRQIPRVQNNQVGMLMAELENNSRTLNLVLEENEKLRQQVENYKIILENLTNDNNRENLDIQQKTYETELNDQLKELQEKLEKSKGEQDNLTLKCDRLQEQNEEQESTIKELKQQVLTLRKSFILYQNQQMQRDQKESLEKVKLLESRVHQMSTLLEERQQKIDEFSKKEQQTNFIDKSLSQLYDSQRQKSHKQLGHLVQPQKFPLKKFIENLQPLTARDRSMRNESPYLSVFNLKRQTVAPQRKKSFIV